MACGQLRTPNAARAPVPSGRSSTQRSRRRRQMTDTHNAPFSTYLDGKKIDLAVTSAARSRLFTPFSFRRRQNRRRAHHESRRYEFGLDEAVTAFLGSYVERTSYFCLSEFSLRLILASEGMGACRTVHVFTIQSTRRRQGPNGRADTS